MKLDMLRKKRDGNLLLKRGFRECGRKNEYKKTVGDKQIHIKWAGGGTSNAGYYAHVDKPPHI